MAVPKEASGEYLCLDISPYLLGLEGSALYRQYIVPVLHQFQVPYFAIRPSQRLLLPILEQLAQCARKAEQANGHYGLDLLADLILLWNHTLDVLPSVDREADCARLNSRMKDILLYLHDNYAHKITLQEIADHIHLSRSECSRVFHTTAGQPLFQYLTQYRIDRSIELLLHSEKTVTEIAYETGFNSQSYFTQRFRAVRGMSPEQFRKHAKERSNDSGR